MSENFDKEAERERLREKYEDDSADREVTERMSQLLLQGATMTNKHCDTCGSPIFRYQGQEFCPTCQAETEAADAAAGTEAADGERTAAAQGAGGEPTNASQPAAGDGSGGASDGSGGQTVGASETTPMGQDSVGTASTGTAELGGGAHQSASANAGGTTDGSTPAAVSQSLATTIVSLSDRARESEDPNRAKKLLEAAREAAETLARLQGL